MKARGSGSIVQVVSRRIVKKSSFAAAFFSVCAALGLWCGRRALSAESGIIIGNNAQLFGDDHLVESTNGLHRQAHRVQKYFPNPVLTYTRTWEGHCVVAWGSVLYDDGERMLKMWYEAYRQNAGPDEETYFLYATSRDGIYWDKPDLSLARFRGSLANNILFHPAALFDSAVVIKDKSESKAERRYKMMYYLRSKDPNERGLYGAVSSDGIHWNTLPGPFVKAGDRSSFFMNPFRSTFVFMSRPGTSAPLTGVTRWLVLWESRDFETLGAMHNVLWPDRQDAPGNRILQPAAVYV